MQRIGNWTLMAIGFCGGFLLASILLDFAILEGRFSWLSRLREWLSALSGWFAGIAALYIGYEHLRPIALQAAHPYKTDALKEQKQRYKLMLDCAHAIQDTEVLPLTSFKTTDTFKLTEIDFGRLREIHSSANDKVRKIARENQNEWHRKVLLILFQHNVINKSQFLKIGKFDDKTLVTDLNFQLTDRSLFAKPQHLEKDLVEAIKRIKRETSERYFAEVNALRQLISAKEDELRSISDQLVVR